MLAERTFFEDATRKRVTAAIKAIEAQTSAEVVVAVRNASASYRDVDYLFGFVTSLVALGVLLFHPYPFAIEGMPLEVIAAFTLGTLVCAKAHPLRRALTSRKRRHAACLEAARAKFVELGIARTRDRNGILIVVSLFERRATLVADVGIDAARLGVEWGERVNALKASLEHGASVDRFLEALDALRPLLSAAMPRRPDDVNELSDEVAE
jgi:putative membrane protein